MAARSEVLTVKVRPSERALIAAAATFSGETIASLIRRATLPVARNLARRAERELRDETKVA